MYSCEIFDGSLSEKTIILQVVLDINASDGPEVPAFCLERDLQCLNIYSDTLPPATVYYFYMFVNVNLTPGSLSLMPI